MKTHLSSFTDILLLQITIKLKSWYIAAPEIIEKTLKCNLKIYIIMLKSFSTLFPKYPSFKIYRLRKRNNLGINCNMLPSIPLNHVHMATQRIHFPALFSNEICCVAKFPLIENEQKWCSYIISLKINYVLSHLFPLPESD